MSTRNGRTIFALAVTALLVLVLATAGVVWWQARDAVSRHPELTAYAHGRAVTVPPFQYCPIRRAPDGRSTVSFEVSACDQGDSIFLETPTGDPLQLSLPRALVSAPWEVQLYYRQADSSELFGRPGPRYSDFDRRVHAVTVDTRGEPGQQLVGVEFQVLIVAVDETGAESLRPHAIWSIRTA